MTPWPEVTLAQVSQKPQYGAIASADDKPVGPRFVRQTDIITGRVDWSGVPYAVLSPSDEEKYRLSPGDLLISRLGAGVGNAACMDDTPGAVFAGYLVRFKVLPSRADSRYVGYVLQSGPWRKHVQAVRSGGAQPTLNAKQMGAFRFALPPLEEQERIAGVLGAFDDLIETNRRLIAGLDDLFQTLWRQDYDSRSNARRQTLAAVASTQYGLTASASDDPTGVKFLRVTDINKQNWINWEGVPTVPISEVQGHKYRLAVGDLLVARMADPGKSAIYEGGPDAVFASYLVRLKPDSYEDGLYLYGFLKSDEYAVYAAGAMTGSVQKNMNAKVISAATLHWPDEEARRAFAEKVAPIRSAQSALLTEATELARRRDELLPLLMSGRVRVRDMASATS